MNELLDRGTCAVSDTTMSTRHHQSFDQSSYFPYPWLSILFIALEMHFTLFNTSTFPNLIYKTAFYLKSQGIAALWSSIFLCNTFLVRFLDHADLHIPKFEKKVFK